MDRPAEYTTAQAKESYAYSHPEYIQHLSDIETAGTEALKLQFWMKSAEIQFEHWRTQSANDRKGYQ